MKRNHLLFLTLYLLFAIALCSYLSLIIYDQTNDLTYALMYFYCSMDFSYDYSFYSLLTTVTPTLFVFSYLYNDIADDINKNCVYIFCRLTNRRDWLIKKYIYFLFKTTKLNIILMGMSCLIFLVLGYKFSNLTSFLFVFIKLLILNVIIQYSLILISNIISLRFAPNAGYCMSFICYMLSVNIYYFTYINEKRWLTFMPFTQNFIRLQYWNERQIVIAVGYLILIACLGFPVIRKKEFY